MKSPCLMLKHIILQEMEVPISENPSIYIYISSINGWFRGTPIPQVPLSVPLSVWCLEWPPEVATSTASSQRLRRPSAATAAVTCWGRSNWKTWDRRKGLGAVGRLEAVFFHHVRTYSIIYVHMYIYILKFIFYTYVYIILYYIILYLDIDIYIYRERDICVCVYMRIYV